MKKYLIGMSMIAFAFLLSACNEKTSQETQPSAETSAPVTPQEVMPPATQQTTQGDMPPVAMEEEPLGWGEWEEWVEEQVPTGDGQGSGPDYGSMEWCGVVEFKLFNRESGLEPCSAAWKEKVTETLKSRSAQ